MLAFPIYENDQLSFLDKQTEMGKRISRSLVRATIDDDVETDDELMAGSKKAMQKELCVGINAFLKGKVAVSQK